MNWLNKIFGFFCNFGHDEFDPPTRQTAGLHDEHSFDLNARCDAEAESYYNTTKLPTFESSNFIAVLEIEIEDAFKAGFGAGLIAAGQCFGAKITKDGKPI